MAQDFHSAFGLGRNERGISTLDSAGVALAGIQALVEENRTLRSELEEVKALVVQMHSEQQGRKVLTRTVLN
jgi:hypothetical protein